MILSKEEIVKYLDCVKNLGKNYPLIDLHVSPFEVIFNEFQYFPNPKYKGIFSMQSAQYKPPSIEPLRIDSPRGKSLLKKNKTVPVNLSLMLYRKFYAHIGPKVLLASMSLSGISKCLLLPVVQPNSDGEEQHRMMFNIYKDDDRFLFGYCIPNTVNNKEILETVKNAHKKYEIKGIKLHPNIQKINLSTKKGTKRIENILEACRVANLPLVIHGGISQVIRNKNSQCYATLGNLSQFDWSITHTPVIISHAGLIGYSHLEIRDLIQQLKRVLSTYNNVMIDISALDVSALHTVLNHIDINRIVFGSDAFYFPQWSAVVKLFYTLRKISPHPERDFIKIAYQNPLNSVLKKSGLRRN